MDFFNPDQTQLQRSIDLATEGAQHLREAVYREEPIAKRAAVRGAEALSDAVLSLCGNPLDKPLTAEQVKARTDASGYLRAIISISLGELACISTDGTLNGLNDYAEEAIFPSGILADISYQVVGADIRNNSVFILVQADVSDSSVLDE